LGIDGDTGETRFTAVVVCLAVGATDRRVEFGADDFGRLDLRNGGWFGLGSFASELGLDSGQDDNAGDEYHEDEEDGEENPERLLTT